MKADFFLWLGPGALMVDVTNLAAHLPARFIVSGLYHHPNVAFAPLSRIPKSVFSAERLAELMKNGTAALDDAGIPGPTKEHVRQCWLTTLARNGAGESGEFQTALRALYTMARDGHEEAAQ